MNPNGVVISTFQLAWRNLVRSFRRRWPVVVILAVAITVLEVGNTLLDSASDGLRRTYTSSFTGDWTVSAPGRESFTLLGSDLPLIGEYYVLPTIPNAEQLLEKLRSTPGIRGAVGQVTAGGMLSLEGWSQAVPVLGVPLSEYISLFPGIQLIEGSLDQSPGSILVNEAQLASMTKTLGRVPAVGEVLTVTTFNDSTFVIRPVTLSGVFRYPASDELLDRVVLADPDTARALNGYVYGTRQGSETAKGTTHDDIDALFFGENDTAVAPASGSLRQEVENQLKDTKLRDTQNAARAGSWNFILVRGDRPEADGLVVRDWKDSAGGNALISWIIQLVFNIGMGTVLFGAAIIGVNSLSLAVSERVREIGTMRALGASRARVSGFVTAEVLLTVTGAGIAGLAAAAGVIGLTHWWGIPISNPYLQSLFGTAVLRPQASWTSFVAHLGLSATLGIIATLRPVRLALRVRPVQAIARGT